MIRPDVRALNEARRGHLRAGPWPTSGTVRDFVLRVLETSYMPWQSDRDIAYLADASYSATMRTLRWLEREGLAARKVTATMRNTLMWGRPPENRKRVRIRLDFVVQMDEEGGGLPKVLGDGPAIGQTTKAARAALSVLGLTGGAIEQVRHRFEVLKPKAKRGEKR